MPDGLKCRSFDGPFSIDAAAAAMIFRAHRLAKRKRSITDVGSIVDPRHHIFPALCFRLPLNPTNTKRELPTADHHRRTRTRTSFSRHPPRYLHIQAIPLCFHRPSAGLLQRASQPVSHDVGGPSRSGGPSCVQQQQRTRRRRRRQGGVGAHHQREMGQVPRAVRACVPCNAVRWKGGSFMPRPSLFSNTPMIGLPDTPMIGLP